MAAIAVAAAAAAADTTTTGSARFTDAEDGWFDLGGFLDTAYGFVPVAMPITEPAVGYGAAAALVFIDRREGAAAKADMRPNITAVGGLITENDSQGLAAGHLGTWLDGRLRTQAGIADIDLNLEFFGLGSGSDPGNDPLDYGIEARGGTAGASYRWGDSRLWFGARYALVNTTVEFGAPGLGLAPIDPADRDLRLGVLTPSLTLDHRDNFFTPVRGWYVDVSVPLFRAAFGSDRDFETMALTGIWYRPVAPDWFFALRGTARTSTDGTPFFLRPYVKLRGVQAISYQGETTVDAEAELRWQFHPRFSMVGFLGAGLAHGSTISGTDDERSVAAGGTGFRYLLARRYGLHMGIDLAFGPDDPVIYVIFGSPWLRP